MRFTIMTVFAVIALATSVAPGAASADNGNIQATFTKWVVGDTDPTADGDLVDMVGTVGGSVGAGTFFGEVLTDTTVGTTDKIHAIYHIKGSRTSFVADNNVTQDDITGIATISGTVVGGPLNNAHVTGGYRTMATCDIPTPGNINPTPGSSHGECFKGTLLITLHSLAS
jgi:hypothetical protein